MKDLKKVEVSAAVIVKDGNVLATQRGYGEFKGKWEFPGGKIEQGETQEEALVREIKEELNADINVIDYLTTVRYDYPDFHLIMHAYICELKNNLEFVFHNEKELEHDNMIWLDKEDLDHLDWLPADVSIVDRYKQIRGIRTV